MERVLKARKFLSVTISARAGTSLREPGAFKQRKTFPAQNKPEGWIGTPAIPTIPRPGC